MSLSVRWRLTLWITATLAATLLVVFFVLNFALRQTLVSDFDDDLSRGVAQISALLLIRGSLDNIDAVQDVVDRSSVGGLSSGFVVVVRDPDGNVVAASTGINSDDLALRQGDIERALAGESFSRNLDTRGGEEIRVRTAAITLGDRVLGVVQVGESTDLIARTLDQLRTLFLLAGGGAVVSTFVVAYWVSRRSLRPMEDVGSVAASIEASDLTKRISAHRQPAEVQRLSDTFDAMLERLESSFQQQRNFVLDVAHELRTPLTALRGNIDVLLMDDKLQHDVRLQLERMSTEVARLIRLTTNLLYLALADTGYELDRRPVELDVVCLEVYRLMRDLRPAVKLRLGNEDQVTVVGDRDLLKQLILNLVENGMKYTPEGGKVTLSLHREEERARLVVEDTGRGLSPDEIPHIFSRFYRGDSAGKRGSGGAGIGLAIVDWIVREHRGEVVVDSQQGKGSAFTVYLPLADSGSDDVLARPQESRSSHGGRDRRKRSLNLRSNVPADAVEREGALGESS